MHTLVFNGYRFTQYQHHNQPRNVCSFIIDEDKVVNEIKIE